MSILSALLRGAKDASELVLDRGDFDPRFAERKSEKALNELSGTKISSEYFNSPELPSQSIFDMEGQPYVITQSDRTGASRLITGIDDVIFNNPVIARGGQDFTIDNEAAWASGAGPIGQIKDLGDLLKKQTGKDPILMPWRMSPTGSDFANMTHEVMLELARSSFSKTDKKKLDKLISQHIGGWKGLDNPESTAQFASLTGDPRKALQKQMDKNFRQAGLDYSKVRLAIADPNQLQSRTGNLQNVSVLDLAGGIGDSTHPAYPFEIYGEAVGRLTEEVPAYALDPRRIGQIKSGEPARVVDLANFTNDDRRALEMGAMGGVITDKNLRLLEKMIAAGVLGGAGSAYAGTGQGESQEADLTDEQRRALYGPGVLEQLGGGLVDSFAEAGSALGEGVVGGVDFMTADIPNFLLDLIGSDMPRAVRIGDIPEVQRHTQGGHMDNGLGRDVIRAGFGMLSPI